MQRISAQLFACSCISRLLRSLSFSEPPFALLAGGLGKSSIAHLEKQRFGTIIAVNYTRKTSKQANNLPKWTGA
jgi:hypothetical protein